MSALFFPSLDTLRLVLASGIVPAELTDTPAHAAIDDQSRVWIVPRVAPPRDLLIKLARLGVRTHAEPGRLVNEYFCWAAVLPLRVAHAAMGSHRSTLFALADRELVTLAKHLRGRDNSPLGIRLIDDGRVWVVTASTHHGDREWDEQFDVYREQAPRIWVANGWEHPVVERLAVPSGHTVLLRPHCAPELLSTTVPVPIADEYALRCQSITTGNGHRLQPITISPKLVRSTRPGGENLWVFDDMRVGDFWEFCRSADEHVLRRIEIATLHTAGLSRVIVRGLNGKQVPPALPFPDCSYVLESRLPGVYWPSRMVLRPDVRARELARLVGRAEDRVVWVEVDANQQPRFHWLPAVAFRPVLERLEYAVPAIRSLDSADDLEESFALERFVLYEELPLAEPVDSPHDERLPARFVPVSSESESASWLTRSLERLTGKRRRVDVSREPPRTEIRDKDSSPSGSRAPARLEQTLTSAESLVHGYDRAARRRELESLLLVECARLNPEQRAMRWAELAAVYAATANPADAAICWINAIWETESPPRSWLEHWLHAECRAAKLNEPRLTLERILGEPGRFGMVRILAAYVAGAVQSPDYQPELVEKSNHVLAFLDQYFDDLPARAAWMVRCALSHLVAGDVLGLARWRDRILQRLRERGPGLDLDEPSFLRFHGTASPDRFQIAREWLGRARGPILAWIGKQAGPSKLQFAGLDPEVECTAAYAQLLLAWGLACLAERTRSRDWAARARKVLSCAAGPGIDPAVHTILTEALMHRIRDAQEGRPAKPGLPPELAARLESLPDFSRYAVDKFRRFVGILEPIDRVRDYRGKEFREFWGHDLLGDRLTLLADRSEPGILSEEAHQLLAICSREPSIEHVPRITFTLLEVATQLDAACVVELLHLVLPALDGLEAWLDRCRWTPTERTLHLPRYQSRLVENAFRVAATANPMPPTRQLALDLIQRARADSALRMALYRVSGSIFRTLRKLGHRAEGEALLHVLDPVMGTVATTTTELQLQLGLAVGWFAAGYDDAGNRILNAARDRLFLSGALDDRERTELVVSYAAALGLAPSRIALGRLEEVFQRLDRVAHTGSTNRYFTIQPLRLVDTVVRAVVTEEFALGPAVRGWLDDDEFLIRRRIHSDMRDALREEGMLSHLQPRESQP